MSNETYVTLQGWLGSDVTTRTVGETIVASFRVGCTPRRFSRKNNEWYDGETQWYTVNAWRALGDNCRRSLKRSDPVVVHGKLNANTWERDGVPVTTMEVEAALVGHDLTRGQSYFTKTPKPSTAEAPPPAERSGDGAPAWAVPGADDPSAPDADADSTGLHVDVRTGEVRGSAA